MEEVKKQGMESLFVPYEIALELKELGFDEPCFAHYCNGDLITKTAILKSSTMLYYQQNNINPNNQYKHQNCTAPLYQQAFRWFREKYKLNSQIAFCEYSIESCNSWKYTFDNPTGQQYWDGEFNTYEEAELECLIRLIEMAKNK
jgi:hypothetical protein